MIRLAFGGGGGVEESEPQKQQQQKQQEQHNSNAVQELLAGASTSMFVNSYGVAISAIDGGKAYLTVWVAVIAAMILALSTVRFWRLRSSWAAEQDWQTSAFLALAVALLAAEIAAIVEVTAYSYARQSLD